MNEETIFNLLLGFLTDNTSPQPQGESGRGLSQADWEGVIQCANGHDVAPLLYRRLMERHVLMPPVVAGRLKDLYLQSSLNALRWKRELSRVFLSLKNAGIAVIVLKGAYLGPGVYGNEALRPMRDIDLLIHPQDVPRAEQCLQECGYIYPSALLSKRQWYEQVHFHFQYCNQASGQMVEIHWNIVRRDNPFRPVIDEIWQHARPARLADVDTLAMAPEHQILHLCTHASEHHFDVGLITLCDISEIIRKYAIDWDWLCLTARRYNIERCVFCILLLARNTLKAPVPLDVLEVLRPDASARKLAEAIGAHIRMRQTRSLQLHGEFAQALAAAGPLERVRLVLLRVFPPLAELRGLYGLSHGSTVVWVFYLMRPFDLLRRRGMEILHVLLRTRRGKWSVEKERARLFIDRYSTQSAISPFPDSQDALAEHSPGGQLKTTVDRKA